MQVRVTVQDAAAAVLAAERGAHGAGVVCLENVILSLGIHPRALLAERGAEGYATLLSTALIPICKAFAGYPVWFRTLDFHDADLAHLRDAPEALPDPPLGRRGIRRDLAWPEHHAAQWLAMRQAHDAGCDNLGVLLSMVHDVEQLHAAQWMRDGAAVGAVCGLGMLVQTPAAALCIESFIDADVDAVVFDTDGLAEWTLGSDPAYPGTEGYAAHAHPAVERLIRGAAAVAAQGGVEVGVCGRGASDPACVPMYATFGIEALSCEPDALPIVRAALDSRQNFTEFRSLKPSRDEPD